MLVQDIVRNAVLRFFPPAMSHSINVCKNIHFKYLEPEMPVLVRLLKAVRRLKGDSIVAIDVGANLGLYSYIFLREKASVIAVEPQPHLVKYLSKVFGSKLDIKQIATSDYKGVAVLRVPRLGALTHLDALATIEKNNKFRDMSMARIQEIEVETDTLDHLTAGIKAIDFIKIDVEGHELSVLRGAQETIRTHKPVLLIEMEKRHNPRVTDVADELFNQGYLGYYCLASKTVQISSTEDFTDIIDKNKGDIRNFFFVPSSKTEVLKELSKQ